MSETIIPAARPTVRDHLARAAALAPYARYVPKNPVMLIGAAVVGLVGVLAWRNREKIADRARPLLQHAAQRGAALRQRLPGRSDPSAS